MNKRIMAGIMTGVMFSVAGQTVAFAMPGDIKEAVMESGYNAYDHTNSYANYSDSDLISIQGYYVATAQAMIRQSPFGEIYGSVTPGQEYYVVGECADCMWYKISGDVSGYVYAAYLVPNSDYFVPAINTEQTWNVRDLNMKMTVTNTSAVHVRRAPSVTGEIITALSEGEEVHVTGNVLNTEWYECKYNGETAYICDDYLTPELPQTMACTAKKLNVRAAADGNSPVIGTLNHGDKERISADENGWLRFSLPDGRIGYVSDEYMAVVDQ